MSNTKLATQLNEILNELKDEDLANMSQDELIALRKKINPYGRTIEGSNKYLNFSITQIHHEYWKKLIITTMVSYLHRMNDEWKVPEGLPVVPVYDYIMDPARADTPASILEKGDPKVVAEYELNRQWMDKRVAVKQFLEEMFQFNPEEHVRSAYRPNRADKERKPVNTVAGQLAVDHLKKVDSEFRSKERLYEDVNATLNAGADVAKKPRKVKVVTKIIKGRNGKPDQKITKKVYVDEDDPNIDTTTKTNGGKDPTAGKTARENIPPHDMFGRFRTYLRENYEEMRDATNDLYCEKPQLELAINPYSWHDTEEEAEDFKKKHKNEVIAEIFTVHSGKWNFFDSFKEQRERVNFYNDQTIILEEMTKQLERDERLGQDLMKKRVEKAKRKNILEDGPDAESFKRWRDQNPEMKKMGATRVDYAVNDECPDDAVQVDVWHTNPTTLEFAKSAFYSAAEAPTFVEEAQQKAKVGAPTTAPAQAPAPVIEPRANNL